MSLEKKTDLEISACSDWEHVIGKNRRVALVLPFLKITRISKQPIKEINYFLF
jgi:hypothetical protein